MKVSAGDLKGLPLFCPSSGVVRPTSAKAKEALMSILSEHLEGASFLDLFSGTGGVGFEALSRGASYVAFVENSREATRCIQRSLKKLAERSSPPPGKAALFSQEVDRYLKAPSSPLFDLIWADPPYASIAPWFDKSLGEKLARKAADQSHFLLEGPVKEIENFSLESSLSFSWKAKKIYRYGHSAIRLWEGKRS